jgi:transcriptional regulator with XRE-family HTH domain
MRGVTLDTDDLVRLETLGKRIRLARLRRNLSQADMAERAGVTRLTYQRLESGHHSTSLALLVRTLAILGYPDRIPNLLESDPDGEELELATGRQYAGAKKDVADF